MEQNLFALIQDGKLENYSSIPRMIETVISRVFIFDQENIVLKFYKRDNEWWNTDMRDLSKGPSRISFIQQDFEFNCFLNPKIYLGLKTAVIDNGLVKLIKPKNTDDELVIIMHKEDISGTFTEVLANNKLSLTDYKNIGQSLARIKLSIPKKFLPPSEMNWYEQMLIRSKDLASWVLSEKDFPQELADQGLTLFNKILAENKQKFQEIKQDDLVVLVDCNSENLIYTNQELRFLDAYSPKDNWRIGTFDIDIFRTGSDIYALSGEDCYLTYLAGVEEVAKDHLDKQLINFHLLYGAMIMSPYLFMLSHKDKKYQEKAEKYLIFFKELIKKC